MLIALGPSAPCHLEEHVWLLGAASLSPARSCGAASIQRHVEHMRETKRPGIRNFLMGLQLFWCLETKNLLPLGAVPDPFPESGQRLMPRCKGQGASQQPDSVTLAGEGCCCILLLFDMCLCVYMCVNALCG